MIDLVIKGNSFVAQKFEKVKFILAQVQQRDLL